MHQSLATIACENSGSQSVVLDQQYSITWDLHTHANSQAPYWEKKWKTLRVGLKELFQQALQIILSSLKVEKHWNSGSIITA